MKPTWVKTDVTTTRGPLGCPLNINRMAVRTSTRHPAIDNSDMNSGRVVAPARAAKVDMAAMSAMTGRKL
jgi:hypothetical protein